MLKLSSIGLCIATKVPGWKKSVRLLELELTRENITSTSLALLYSTTTTVLLKPCATSETEIYRHFLMGRSELEAVLGGQNFPGKPSPVPQASSWTFRLAR